MSTVSATLPPLPRGLRGYSTLLKRNKNVRAIWTGQVISGLGDWFNTIAVLGLLLQLTHNPSSAALAIVTGILPSAIAGITVAGYVADRFNRKHVMIAADLVRALIALSFLFVTTPDRVWLAYLGTAGLSFVSAFFYPASSASMPNLVQRDELPVVNALGQSTFATSIFIGAALGGAVSQAFGREACFVLNALSFVLSALSISRATGVFNVDSRVSMAGASAMRLLTEGARYLRTDATVRSYVLVKLAWSWVFGGMGLYSVFALDVYHVGDIATSWLYFARGVGAFLTPLLIGSIITLQNHAKLKVAIRAGLFISVIGYVIFALSTAPWQGMIGTFLGHAGGSLVWTFSGMLVQAGTPDRVRGRVLALDSVITSGVMALANLVAGAVAAYTGNPHVAGLTTAGISLVGACIWLWAARGK